MKVVDAQCGFETGDSELVEWPTGVVDLHCWSENMNEDEAMTQVPLCRSAGSPLAVTPAVIPVHNGFLLL
jgi:hypothetical protein